MASKAGLAKMAKARAAEPSPVEEMAAPAVVPVAAPVADSGPVDKEDIVANWTGDRLRKLYGTNSECIRKMHFTYGMTASEIAKVLGCLYQNARNVIQRPLKRQIKAEREAARRNGQTT